MKIINSDLMKPTFDDLLNAPSSSPMTSTHMNYMMNPIIMVSVSYTHLDVYKRQTLTYSEIMIRYGELSTKGKNRMRFINKLRNNIQDVLSIYPAVKVTADRDRAHAYLPVSYTHLSANFYEVP